MSFFHSARSIVPRVVMRVSRIPLRSFRSSACQAVNITFKEESSGDVIKVDVEEGKTILDAAIENNVDIEGACGGELACSTCHVILPQRYYDKLGEKSEEEEDMLDLAWGVTDCSRLGCQIKLTKELEGMELVVPAESNNSMM